MPDRVIDTFCLCCGSRAEECCNSSWPAAYKFNDCIIPSSGFVNPRIYSKLNYTVVNPVVSHDGDGSTGMSNPSGSIDMCEPNCAGFYSGYGLYKKLTIGGGVTRTFNGDRHSAELTTAVSVPVVNRNIYGDYGVFLYEDDFYYQEERRESFSGGVVVSSGAKFYGVYSSMQIKRKRGTFRLTSDSNTFVDTIFETHGWGSSRPNINQGTGVGTSCEEETFPPPPFFSGVANLTVVPPELRPTQNLGKRACPGISFNFSTDILVPLRFLDTDRVRQILQRIQEIGQMQLPGPPPEQLALTNELDAPASTRLTVSGNMSPTCVDSYGGILDFTYVMGRHTYSGQVTGGIERLGQNLYRFGWMVPSTVWPAPAYGFLIGSNQFYLASQRECCIANAGSIQVDDTAVGYFRLWIDLDRYNVHPPQPNRPSAHHITNYARFIYQNARVTISSLGVPNPACCPEPPPPPTQKCIQFGVDRTATATTSGKLKLYYNDENYGDNGGLWDIEVFVNGTSRGVFIVYGNGDVTNTNIQIEPGDTIRTVQLHAPNGSSDPPLENDLPLRSAVIYWSGFPPPNSNAYVGWTDADGKGYSWTVPGIQPSGSDYWFQFNPTCDSPSDAFACRNACRLSLVGDIEP